MFKHWKIHHGSLGEPNFEIKVVGFHKTALSRQIGEAVRILRRGTGSVLNNKSEFSRCKIARLTLKATREVKGGKEQTTE